MLRSDLCDFSDAYIVVKWTITVTGTTSRSRKNRPLAFKHNAPFISCISKIDNTLIDNPEDLDVAMPIYNLIEYNKNYRKTTGGIITDEVTDGRNDNDFVNKNIINWESFLNTRQVLQEVLIMLMKKLPMQRVMKLIILLMMQTKLVKKKLKLLFH